MVYTGSMNGEKTYITQGIKVRRALYKQMISHLHRQEKTFTGWLEEKMTEELGGHDGTDSEEQGSYR